MAPEHTQPSFDIPKPQASYFFENGLRKVKPYFYVNDTWAKSRWFGKTVLEVYQGWAFTKSEQECIEVIQNGGVLLNGQPADPRAMVKDGDLISNIVHMHEAPVTAQPVRIIYDGRQEGGDGVTVVVEKPGSMPVHPTGGFHFNTMLEVVKHEQGISDLYTGNRLDRLTSGVLVCALTSKGAQELGAVFGSASKNDKDDRQLKKEYLARCTGDFGENVITCDAPLREIPGRLNRYEVHEEGRPSRTIIRRLVYDAGTNSSIVHCIPVTGRSHQIRVHLASLGHPIGNDPTYNELGAITRVEEKANESGFTGSTCPDCGKAARVDPAPEQLYIWLHALRYSTKSWTYESQMPFWASEMGCKLSDTVGLD